MLLLLQASCLGSILSNLLLVLGMSFFAAGIKHHTSNFNSTAAQAILLLLLLLLIIIIIIICCRQTPPYQQLQQPPPHPPLPLSHLPSDEMMRIVSA